MPTDLPADLRASVATSRRPSGCHRWLVLCLAIACRREPADAGEDDKPAPAAVTCKPAVATTIDDTIEVTGVIAPPPLIAADPRDSIRTEVRAVLHEPFQAAGEFGKPLKGVLLDRLHRQVLRREVQHLRLAHVALRQLLHRRRERVPRSLPSVYVPPRKISGASRKWL
jgi:hypothetical protein